MEEGEMPPSVRVQQESSKTDILPTSSKARWKQELTVQPKGLTQVTEHASTTALHLHTENCTQALDSTCRCVCTVVIGQQSETVLGAAGWSTPKCLLWPSEARTLVLGERRDPALFCIHSMTLSLLTCCVMCSCITFAIRLCPPLGAGSPASSAHEDSVMKRRRRG